MNETLTILAAALDVPNWALWLGGGGLAVLWGFLWYNADSRYVKLAAYKSDQDRIMSDAKDRDKRAEDRSTALTAANAAFQATVNAQLDAMKTAEQSHHDALRTSLHDTRNAINASILEVAKELANVTGQLSVLVQHKENGR